MVHISKTLLNSIQNEYDNLEFSMEDIAQIMQLAREEFHIDKIILYSNQEYRYQLSHVLTCSTEGVQYHEPVTYALTKAEYQKQLQMYQKNPVADTPIPQLERLMDGCFLNTGILRGREYFGTITFWPKEKRIWNEEEKYVLLKLRYLCLIFFGMNKLVHGINCYKQALEKFQEDNVVAGFFVNMRTKEINPA